VRGINPEFKHEPICFGDRGKIIGYYGLVVMMDPNVPPIVETMSVEEVRQFAMQYSKTYSRDKNTFSGPWGSDFTSMAKKTLMLKAMKNAPIKSEFINTIVAEETETKPESEVSGTSVSPLEESKDIQESEEAPAEG
jgi:recombination protein RecT